MLQLPVQATLKSLLVGGVWIGINTNSIHMLKVNYKQNELPQFLEKFKELLVDQEQEVKKAILGWDKYELRRQYQSWHISKAKWFSMTSVQKHYLPKQSGFLWPAQRLHKVILFKCHQHMVFKWETLFTLHFISTHHHVVFYVRRMAL